MRRCVRGLLVILPLAFLVALPASGTTYVLPPDGSLVDQADVVAQVAVVAVEPAPIDGPPATDYFVQIERVLKGYVAGGTVVVRVPGGIGPDGMGLRIWGAPRFREGERLLLFLAPRDDGTYGVLHLMLGAFFERETAGRRVAVRALAEAVEVSAEQLEGVEPLRDYQGFVDWIGARVDGETAAGDYLLFEVSRHLRAAVESPILLEDSCTQLRFRWFEFDRGESVPWSFHAAGFDGLGAGRRSLERARRQWTRRSELPIRLARSVRTSAAAGLTSFDGLNTVLFDDPEDLVSGAFRCSAGGVVSISGLWFDNGRGQACERVSAGRKGTLRDRRYLEILGADIVVNDGAACLFRGDPAATTQVLGHELGHTLGLAHSTSEEALMWGEVRDGGAGAALRGADREALRELYRED